MIKYWILHTDMLQLGWPYTEILYSWVDLAQRYCIVVLTLHIDTVQLGWPYTDTVWLGWPYTEILYGWVDLTQRYCTVGLTLHRDTVQLGWPYTEIYYSQVDCTHTLQSGWPLIWKLKTINDGLSLFKSVVTARRGWFLPSGVYVRCGARPK